MGSLCVINKINTHVGYIDELVEEAVKNCKDAPSTSVSETSDIPPPLSAGYDQPKKDVAVAQHRSRFAAQRIDNQVQPTQQ